jgi:hypothetical protein
MMGQPTPKEFAKVMIRTMVIPFSLLFMVVTCSCTKEDHSSTILLGEYEVYETIIEKPDETLVFEQNNEKLVFTSTDVYWYYLNNEEWISTGDVSLTYVGDQLVKVGCRTVVSYDQHHISWEQDDWVITRRFK